MAKQTGLVARTVPACGPIDVPALWKRLDTWLKQHARHLAGHMASRATHKECDAFEKAIGSPLPDEVRKSFLTHNGQRDPFYQRPIFYGFHFLSLEESLRYWKRWKRNAGEPNDYYDEGQSLPKDAIKISIANVKWVPLIETTDDSFLGIDLDPGPNGMSGQVINFGDREQHKSVLAWSWGWFLNDLIEEVERSNFDQNRENQLTLKSPRPPYSNFCNIIPRWAKSKNGGRRPLSLANRAFATSSVVRSLAEGIVKDRAFDHLPILADALEEAGCTDREILSHCREPGEHLHGCWLIDLLLNEADVPPPATSKPKTSKATVGKQRRFEFSEGKSNKFWEISVKGSDVTVRFGRIGTDGQTQAKTFSDSAAAQKHADKLVGEKVGKGYREQPVSTSQSRSPAR